MQLLGYLILDLDNDYQAQRIGIWLPRQATVKTWTIEEILGNDASTILAKARVDVESVMEHGGGGGGVTSNNLTFRNNRQTCQERNYNDASQLGTIQW